MFLSFCVKMCVLSKQILSEKVRNEKSGKLLLKSFHRQRLVKYRKGEKNCKNQCSSLWLLFTPSSSDYSRHHVSVLSFRFFVLSQEETVMLSLFPFLSLHFFLLLPFLLLSLLFILLPLLLYSVSNRVICLQTWFLFLVQITFCLIKVKSVN